MAASVVSKVAKNTPALSRYFIGICLPGLKENAAKIRIPRLSMDKYIHMYFKKYTYIFAHDPENLCKVGDTVLIRTLPEKMTRLIAHEVVEIIYPLGDVVDPVTGKKVVVSQYRDDIRADRESGFRSGFDYDKAPPRGSTEGKHDFTHRVHRLKYYEGQPDTV